MQCFDHPPCTRQGTSSAESAVSTGMGSEGRCKSLSTTHVGQESRMYEQMTKRSLQNEIHLVQWQPAFASGE